MFVLVKELDYDNKIVLVIREKFVEIFKVGKNIKDGLRAEKISHVVASPISWACRRTRGKICLQSIVFLNKRNLNEALILPRSFSMTTVKMDILSNA